jgi:hypothetical protein
MTARAWAIVLAACALLLTTPKQAAAFVVNSTVDGVDALPGDGSAPTHQAGARRARR